MPGSDAKALRKLADVAGDHRELSAAARAVRVRRDFLIMACYRRGISLRDIAKAAGLHFSRIQQLVAEGERAIAENDLEPLQRRADRYKGKDRND